MAATLGATRPTGTSPFVLFVPSVTRSGDTVDHDYWVDEALSLFASLFRGATAYPRGRGRWRDDERGGSLVADEPTVVTCCAVPQDITGEALARVRGFLHRLGREADQGEVGIVF